MDDYPSPTCIGFIMDGNRRWAAARGEDSLAGHQAGREAFHRSVAFVCERGIPHAVYYAFSTENWKRSEREVSYLMALFAALLEDLTEQLAREQVRVRFIGRREDFAPALQAQMDALEAANAEYGEGGTTVWVALSYGGRAEIVAAVNAAIAAGESVDEAAFERLLWTAELPDPDLIVRTSGEQRLSNFLTWKSVYSELYFTEKLWPELHAEDFAAILEEYAHRERRRGK